MPRKKRKTAKPKLPLAAGEVWEIGQRPMTALAPLPEDDMSDLPTMLFVVEADSGSVVFGAPLLPGSPTEEIVESVRQAMREPLFDEPRRPEMIRVSSEVEAEILRAGLDELETEIEVSDTLAAIDAVHNNILDMLGPIDYDYRARAEAVGETLSDDSLHAIYRIARTFYRKALWESFDDSEIFSISVESKDGNIQTRYGVLMGSMGEEFGLALFASLDDLQQMYEIDLDALDSFPELADEDETDEAFNPDMAAHLLSVQSVSLTYTAKRDLPPPVLEEAQLLKLPVAKQSAYPFMMRTGQGMQLAIPGELHLIYTALYAILDWAKQIEKPDLEDDTGEALTVEIPALGDAFPPLTVSVALIANPFAEGDDFNDDLVNIDLGQMKALFDPSLFNALADLDDATAPQPKSAPKKTAKKSGGKPPATKSDQAYTLKVFLMSGPVDDEFEEEEISREIHLLGHHTLHDLHRMIFDAFEREEEHLYEFNLGSGPADRSRLYFYDGGWRDDEDDTGDPTTATLDALDLSESQYFGYTFDMGDQWEHVIEVRSIKRGAGKGKYPRIGKKTGQAPPQHPDFDDDEDDEDFI